MGCDIHVKIQYKVKEEWKDLDIPSGLLPNDRNYDLFSVLSHVRGRTNRKPLMREGWPKDLGTINQDTDYHNHGFCYLDEIRKAEGIDDTYFKLFFDEIIDRFPDIYSMEPRDIRILVCYDS